MAESVLRGPDRLDSLLSMLALSSPLALWTWQLTLPFGLYSCHLHRGLEVGGNDLAEDG